MPKYLIALGSNLEKKNQTRSEIIKEAVGYLTLFNIILIKISSLWESNSFADKGQPKFVNAVIEVYSELTPSQILYSLKNIEKKFGRKVGQRWGNRVLDLDILGKGSTILPNLKVFNNWMRMPFEMQIRKQPIELILPHPRIQDRLFVLQPLKEVNPNWVHPVLNQTAKDLILSKDWGKEDLLKKIENKNFLLKC